MPEKWVLKQYQSLPLSAKVGMTQNRIIEWYNHFNGDVCISFSGGKDSTVLAHLVRYFYPDVPMVFSNTGLEYPEIQNFARKMGAVFIRPKVSFSEVISKYGYPIISKENAHAIYYARRIMSNEKNDSIERQRGYMTTVQKRNELSGCKNGDDTDKRRKFSKEKWLPLCRDAAFKISHMCCSIMKKGPISTYLRKTRTYPYIGTLTDESRLREQAWLRNGCNAWEGKKKTSQPMSFWTEQDVLHYILKENLEIASVYGNIVAVDDDGMEYEPNLMRCGMLKCTGCDRTGCIFCGFGVHLERDETRFQRLAKTHPKQYEYCLNGGQWVDNPDYDPTAPEYDDYWKNWNPKKIWVPSKEGLGMKHVFDECNQIYGKDFIRYD